MRRIVLLAALLGAPTLAHARAPAGASPLGQATPIGGAAQIVPGTSSGAGLGSATGGLPVSASASAPAAATTTVQAQASTPPVTTTVGGPALPGPQTNVVFVSPDQTIVAPPNMNLPPDLNVVNPVSLATLATPSQIATAQVALAALGVYRGPVNGLLTGGTRAALANFQSQAAIPVTGTLDPQTAGALGLGTGVTASQQNQVLTTVALQNVATGIVGPSTTTLQPQSLSVPLRGAMPTVQMLQTVPNLQP